MRYSIVVHRRPRRPVDLVPCSPMPAKGRQQAGPGTTRPGSPREISATPDDDRSTTPVRTLPAHPGGFPSRLVTAGTGRAAGRGLIL